MSSASESIKPTQQPADCRRERERVIDAANLFDGASEVRLVHRGQEYRLRITKAGKLILTK